MSIGEKKKLTSRTFPIVIIVGAVFNLQSKSLMQKYVLGIAQSVCMFQYSLYNIKM